ncbi:hypothetical protein ACLQ28_01400 [Micromonospora sp. DT201]|uniref:hypothetical protein n=1 Tax=Micromonospora sp. DT201 TaxID=3393442 RepID=UPI003CEC97BA
MLDTHFEGGSNQDNSKGLFLPTVTKRGLAIIFDAGLKDSGPWILNAKGYYEKTFAYGNVGKKSLQYGNGGAADYVTLVVSRFPNEWGLVDVITMFPADK